MLTNLIYIGCVCTGCVWLVLLGFCVDAFPWVGVSLFVLIPLVLGLMLDCYVCLL